MSHTRPRATIPHPSPRITLGAALWLLCFQFFLAEQIARLHVRGSYSLARNSISDLGALHHFGIGFYPATSVSPLHALMNSSFSLQGLLIFLGAILLKRLFPPGALATTAWLSFVLSGISLLIVGLAPEDTGGQLHILTASVHFVCGSLAMLLFGIAWRSTNQLAAALSVIAGAIALLSTLTLGFRSTAVWHTFNLQLGIVERVAAYPLPLWLTLTGLVLLVRMRKAKVSTPSI